MNGQQLDALPIPGHFNPADPKNAVDLRFIDYSGLAAAADDWRRKHNVQPAVKDRVRVTVLSIDMQNTFCSPNGQLFVAGRSGDGAVQDTGRALSFMYREMHRITKHVCTKDTHRTFAAFHPSFWVDENGNHPAPFTLISLDDVKTGKWKVSPQAAAALGISLVWLMRYMEHYCSVLEQRGRYALTIWPYHGMLGGVGHALVSGLEEACFFHSLVRGAQTDFQVKGTNPLTENYSVLGPEVLTAPDGKAIAQRSTGFVQDLLDADVVVILGQAKSHCVAWSIDDLLTDIQKQDPALARKIYLLSDCTSPVTVPDGNGGFVVDYTDDADKAFARFEAAGMHVVKSTDPMHTWPGINF